MALVKSQLQGEILELTSGFNAGPVAAKGLAGAITNYWSAGQSPQGGFAQAGAVKPLLISGMITAFSGFKEIPVCAKLTAAAIHAAWVTCMFAGGTHGTGGVEPSAPKSLLENELRDAFTLKLSNVEFANKFASAIHNYTTGSTCYGSGSPPPVPSFASAPIT